MAAEVRCEDLGFDCDGVLRADTEAELIQDVIKHAKEVHGLEGVTAEIIDKIKSFTYEVE